MRHSVSLVLPYAPEQLVALVGDVEAYPQFIPWITSMRTWNATPAQVDAEATVGFSFLKERFATRVRRDAGEITVSLLHGPFKRLFNRWRFTAHPDGTQVDFEIDFEFKAKLLDALLKANFHHAVDRLIGCFVGRANELYGAEARNRASPP